MKARSAWDEVGARKRTIPARSPDLNPIENIFHIAKRRLHQDALGQQITRQDFAAFSARVKTKLETIPIDGVDRTPWTRESMKLQNEKDRELNTSFVFSCS